MEVAEAMETLRMDKAWRRVHDQVEAVQANAGSGGNDTMKDVGVRHAEKVLAEHRAAMLENVWKVNLGFGKISADHYLTLAT
eukprot:c22175_g2_i1 orf=773-1018(-)